MDPPRGKNPPRPLLLRQTRLQEIFVNFADTAGRVGISYRWGGAGSREPMVRLFKHYVPHAVLALWLLDFALLLVAYAAVLFAIADACIRHGLAVAECLQRH